MLLLYLALIFLLVGLNGFFVSVEFAAVASRRSRIEFLANSGQPAALIVKSWLENPAARDRLIAASQLGITIASLALGAIGENTFETLLAPFFDGLHMPPWLAVLEPALAALPLVLSLIIVTSIHVVLGEQVPKVAALHDPEGMALFAARPMRLFAAVFQGFIKILDWATRRILNLAGLKITGDHLMATYTLEEIRHILDESQETGVIQAPERAMLESIFDFGGLAVRQVMIPRTEIVAVEADTPLDEIAALVTQSTYTKFPIYEDNLDQILGIVHVKDLLRAIQSPQEPPLCARDLAREPLYVPESATVSVLLQRFRADRQHIAIVMDEYGGTAGLVTLEDLLEEIVGEVSDPFDKATLEIELLPNGSARIDGRVLIEDVNQQLGLDLQDPNYDTIAGFILGRLGRMAHSGDVVEGDGISLRVETVDGMRIATVMLVRQPSRPVPPPEPPPAAG